MVTTRILSVTVLLTILLSTPAAASVWVYEQQTTNSPGFSIDVTITMTGSATLGDIPSLNSTTVTAPIDFSPLTALSFIQHGSLPQIGFTGTLADFAPECLSGPCLTGFPTWVMAPYIIDLEADALDNASYDIRIAPGTLAATISYDTDAFDGCCGGDYLTTGIFVAEVSEPDPFSLLLLAGALVIALHRLRRSDNRGSLAGLPLNL